MFEIFDVPDDTHELPEQLGTKFKFWFKDEGSVDYLFKQGRPGTGENWAEKVASQLCDLLDIPHAIYELALWQDLEGVICQNFVPDSCRLVHGNELLVTKSSNYPHTQFYKVKEHALRVVLTIMRSPTINPPLNWEKNGYIRSALDIFIGYLMLDTWIANQDRHHENWALILTNENTTHLAPTYDHASSLGRNESDEKRKIKLETKDQRQNIEYYVTKAKSAFYGYGKNSKQLSTLEAFIFAGKLSKLAARSWLEKIESISAEQTLQILTSIPNTIISDIAIEFAQEMLYLNKTRLLNTVGEFK